MLNQAEIIKVLGAGETAIAKLSDDDKRQVRAFLRQVGIINSSSSEVDYADALPMLKESKSDAALKQVVEATKAYYRKNADDCSCVTIKIDREGLKVAHLTPLYDASPDKKGPGGKPLPVNTRKTVKDRTLIAL